MRVGGAGPSACGASHVDAETKSLADGKLTSSHLVGVVALRVRARRDRQHEGRGRDDGEGSHLFRFSRVYLGQCRTWPVLTAPAHL